MNLSRIVFTIENGAILFAKAPQHPAMDLYVRKNSRFFLHKKQKKIGWIMPVVPIRRVVNIFLASSKRPYGFLVFKNEVELFTSSVAQGKPTSLCVPPLPGLGSCSEYK